MAVPIKHSRPKQLDLVYKLLKFKKRQGERPLITE